MTDEKKLKVLEDARKLLSEPTSWTKCAMARTMGGIKCGERDPEAVCWCSLGAMVRVTDYLESDVITELQKSCGGSVMAWNDEEGRTHEEVLDAFDRAIEAVRYRVENKQ